MRGWLVAVALLIAVGILIVPSRPAPSFAVEGNFVLWDRYPGKVEGARCTGERSIYHGINASTQVTVETTRGTEVAASALGDGRIASGDELAALARRAGSPATTADLDELLEEMELLPCLFTFELDVTAVRSNDYIVRVGRWGHVTMSEGDLRKPGSVQLSVGLR